MASRWNLPPFEAGLAGIAVAGLIAAAGAGIAAQHSSAEPASGEAAYRQLEELPTTAVGLERVEITARQLVHAMGGLPVSVDQPDVPCPLARLQVSWEEPEGYLLGAHLEPVGPAPGPQTRSVNGVVVCRDADLAYAGFEAARAPGSEVWEISLVPTITGEYTLHRLDVPPPDELRLPDLSTVGRFESFAGLDLGPVDPYAPFQPQRLCDPSPKRGAVGLAQLLLERYPTTRNLGIVRSCTLGPRSEHKEGRAFDWGARIDDPEEAGAAADLLRRLLASDADGNRHALARRLGVMYIIWDGYLWASYRAEDGWRPYQGPSAHTDHVHISLSWDGAQGRTSLWEAVGVDGWWAAMPALAGRDPLWFLPLALPVVEESTGEAGGGAGAGEAPDDGTGDPPDDGGDGAGSGEDGGADDVTGDVGDVVDDVTGDVGDVVDDVTGDVDDVVDDVGDIVDDILPTPLPSPSLPALPGG